MFPAAFGVAVGVVADRAGVGWGTAGWGVWAFVGVGIARLECRGTIVGLVLAFVGVGGAWHHRAWSDLARDDLARGVAEGSAPRPSWLRGVVDETPLFRADLERPGGQGTTRTVVAVTGVCDGRDWHAASGRVATWIGGDRTDLEPGRPVEMAGGLGPIDGPLNPGERDARDFWRADGVRLRLAVDGPSGVWADPDGATWPATYALGRLRAWSHRRLVAGLDPSIAPLASALLLGRRDAIDPELNDAFARTGTTHLLAFSGLQLQALAGLIWLVCRAAKVGYRTTLWTVMIGASAYAILVGLEPSVARSLAMTLAACLAGLLARGPRPANLMAAAAFATLALNPAYLFDVGCQLSFLAIAALFWGVPAALGWLRPKPGALDATERFYESRWRKRLRRVGRWFVDGLVASVVVWLAAWPLVAFRFHMTSPMGILLNLPLVPMTSFAMLAAGLSLGLAALWAPLGAPAAWTCRELLGATDALVRWGARQGWGHWFGPGPSEAWVVGFYVLLALAAAGTLNGWGRRVERSAWIVLLSFSAAMLAVLWIPITPGRPEAEVLAVGHGLAVVLRSGDGHALLYDAGRMADPHSGRRLIAPALWARGVNRLDIVVLSHADSDHYNALPDLLERFPIGVVLVPHGFGGAANPGALDLLKSIEARGIPIRTIARGEGWDLGRDLRLEVLHPPEAARPGAKDNERSVVLSVESGGRRLLLTGDLDGSGLADLTAQTAPKIDVFLSPHHGGRTANPPWLYHWANAGLVVASQRRPAPGTRDALDAVAAPVRRTWQRGAIRLRWTDLGIEPSAFLDTLRPTPPGTRPMPLATLLPTSTALVAALGLLGGMLLIALVAVVEWGAWILVMPGRAIALPADEPYPGEHIEIDAPDGVRLAGTWHAHPDAGGRTLVLLHGLAEGRHMMRVRSDEIFARGWNIAVLDARGYGDSGGELGSFGGREVGDLSLWLDTIAARVGPGLRLAIWGRSMGAGVALRAAAIEPRIHALVLEAPYIDLRRTAATLIRRYRLPASRILAVLVLARARRLAGVSLDRPRPLDAAPHVKVPALILRGTADALVSEEETATLAGALGGPVERVDVPGARHSKIVDVGGPELIERVGAFLDRTA
jgi:competence protein ComEC